MDKEAKNWIYLDNNATTGLDPQVKKALWQHDTASPSNPSSVHFFGRKARSKLIEAREKISAFFHLKPQEVIFTSGGTESLNFLIRGTLAKIPQGSPIHVITSNTEHACIYNTLKAFESKGVEVSYLPSGLWGAPTVENIQNAVRPHTRLIVLSAANNETGVKIDLEKIGALAYQKEIPFVVDGVALLGKEPFSIPKGVLGMGFSGHKIHGPKGIGLALVRSSLSLEPLLTGGPQEYSLRAGTENLEGILALSQAIKLLPQVLLTAPSRMQRLRDRFEEGLKSQLDNVLINGEGPRISNTSNLCFEGIDGELLLLQLDMQAVAASHGSACSSGALEPSRVLLNMGLSPSRARSSLRFSLSRWTTEEEIEEAILRITHTVKGLRALSEKGR